MAGYSLVCYLLQSPHAALPKMHLIFSLKDRHNGNLLLDEEGHTIHIDFGFVLSNSPGGVNFESATFKLTCKPLEVMDSDAKGVPSKFFDYFKVLSVQGFLTCYEHAERIILLVEMFQVRKNEPLMLWVRQVIYVAGWERKLYDKCMSDLVVKMEDILDACCLSFYGH